MYKSQFKSQSAIEHYKKSLRYFNKTENVQYYIASIKIIGDLYCSINQDSANLYAQQCVKLAKETNDESLELFGYTIKARLYFYNEEWDKTKEWSKKILDAPDEISHEKDPYYYLCISYIKTGNIDSAQIVMNQIPMPISISDSLSYYQCLSDLAEAKCNYDNSVEYQKVPDDINTTIDHKLQDNNLVIIEKNIDSKHIDQTHQTIIYGCIVLILSIILLVAIIGLLVRRNHKKTIDDYEKQLREAQEKTSQLIRQLDYIKTKNDNFILQLKKNKDSYNSESLQRQKKLISSIEGSLSCYSSLMTNLLKQMKASSGEKNSKLALVSAKRFFLLVPVFFVPEEQVEDGLQLNQPYRCKQLVC